MAPFAQAEQRRGLAADFRGSLAGKRLHELFRKRGKVPEKIAKRLEPEIEGLAIVQSERSELPFQTVAARGANRFLAQSAPFGPRLWQCEQFLQRRRHGRLMRATEERKSVCRATFVKVDAPDTLVMVRHEQTSVRRHINIDEGKIDELAVGIARAGFGTREY